MARGIDPTLVTHEPQDQSKCYCGPEGNPTQAAVLESLPGDRAHFRCPDCGHEWIGYTEAIEHA